MSQPDTDQHDGQIDFYFDFLSPYAYLAQHRLRKIATAHNREICYRPVDLKQVKDAIGNTGPGNRDLPIKLEYIWQDLARWAKRYAMPFARVPNYNTTMINTGFFLAQAQGRDASYVQEAYRLTWGAGRAPDDPSVISELTTLMGWRESEFTGYVQSEEAAQKFQASTDEAIERRVFGVPTMLVDGEMWWGNDRLDLLDAALGGRDTTAQPAQFGNGQILYFEDMIPGQALTSPSHTIERAEMVAFARIWDPLPIHVDEQAGIKAFGSLTAPGVYMLAVKQRLIHQLPAQAVIASLGYDEVRFLRPLRPDDTVMLRQEWVDKRVSNSKPDRGVVTIRFSLVNQDREIVMTHLDTVLVGKRGVLRG